MRWLAVSDTDKRDLFLLVGGGELQKLIETLPEQPTNYESHIQELNNHFEAHRNNTLELYKFFNIAWPTAYQTLSPARRTFVFLGSRRTQPLTARNAHAQRCEFSKWRISQRGKEKNQSGFATNTQHKPPLKRLIQRKKIQSCMILKSRRLITPTKN